MRFGDRELSPPLVVAAIGDSPEVSAKRAKQMGADVLELRIDLLGATGAADVARTLGHLGLPMIATNRLAAEGGKWDGSEEERISVLQSVLGYCDAVDIELCAEKAPAVIDDVKRMGKTVIVSSHDFKRTPSRKEMAAILENAFSLGADIAKLAVTPASLEDVLALFEVTLHAGRPVCTIAMGELGRHTRAVLPIYGSVLTYGSAGKATAPGQMRVDELVSELRLLGAK
ncbi:MAG TPA: type I 3-dehydroquinate dehydratase [Candidatus Methanoperedenaceae archaeon]|nr:type I 3-dehydroquinate dehydratase [Candidatus Methanoperedenaceae archaeon]